MNVQGGTGGRRSRELFPKKCTNKSSECSIKKKGWKKWKNLQKKSAYQKLLERNKGARGIRRIKMDLEDIHGKIMNKKKISRIMKELNLRTKK